MPSGFSLTPVTVLIVVLVLTAILVLTVRGRR
jgi:hypothetical protein